MFFAGKGRYASQTYPAGRGPQGPQGPQGGAGSSGIVIGDAIDASALMNPGDEPGFAQISYSWIGSELVKIDLSATMGNGGTGPAGYGLEVPLPAGYQVNPTKIVGGSPSQGGSNFSCSGYCVIASMASAFNSLLATYAISDPLTAIRVATFTGDIGATTVTWAEGDLIRLTIWVPVIQP